jgi:hypothetical protein
MLSMVMGFLLYWDGLFCSHHFCYHFTVRVFSACLLERSHEARSFVQIKQARRSIGWAWCPKRKGKSKCLKNTANEEQWLVWDD